METLRYAKKAQVLLTVQQFNVLQQVARQQKKKLGTVLREAFARLYVERQRDAEVDSACTRLLQLKAPTTDWARFEKSYAKRKYDRPT
ncbi:MAG: hypothetical protein HY696_06925 [Deltaproteobacteria bacterium]|nr:hypothetical protein [Deltaproteobacteria bacterium]